MVEHRIRCKGCQKELEVGQKVQVNKNNRETFCSNDCAIHNVVATSNRVELIKTVKCIGCDADLTGEVCPGCGNSFTMHTQVNCSANGIHYCGFGCEARSSFVEEVLE